MKRVRFPACGETNDVELASTRSDNFIPLSALLPTFPALEKLAPQHKASPSEEILPNQRHAHAPGPAPTPGQLAARYGMDLDAVVLQHPVGNGVTRIDHHLPRGDGQGVAAVAPLFPGRAHHAAAAAGDQSHAVQFQVLLQKEIYAFLNYYLLH